MDFYHVADAFFAARRRILRTYGARSLVRHFEVRAADSPDGKQILAKLDYFRTNLHRMEYGAFCRKGLVIGAGAVEGSCQSLVKQRADLSGQRWHPQGALNVLCIRGMVLADIHAAYWQNEECPSLLPPHELRATMSSPNSQRRLAPPFALFLSIVHGGATASQESF